MYFLCGLRIVVIKNDHTFTSSSDLVLGLPTLPRLDWSAASEHCGLIEQNICFLKEKVCFIYHSLPFERVTRHHMKVRMVLHIVMFVNGIPWKGGMKHFSPEESMTNQHLHVNGLHLTFGSYAHVAENIEPRNSLAPHTRAAILLESSGNLSGGQIFLALDTDHTNAR
jgi:hypothetical protein